MSGRAREHQLSGMAGLIKVWRNKNIKKVERKKDEGGLLSWGD